MAKTHYQVIVVGAGPAGAAAAYTAAGAGLSVCIIDKAIFPRDKLCGGLVTGRSKKLFEAIFDRKWRDDLITSSDDIHFYYSGRFLAQQQGYSQLYFTMRLKFDEYLLSLAAEKGADCRLGSSIEKLNLLERRVTLASGEELTWDFLIGSDGVNTQVGRQLFGRSFNNETIGFGLEVEVPRQDLPDAGDAVEIDFGAAAWGYGWTFPKEKTLTIGVGGIHRLNPDLRQKLAAYLLAKKLDPASYRAKGQFIPFGDVRSDPVQGRVFLCGDAAGTVDPITGEGIGYAMESGHSAALAISESFQKGDLDRAAARYRKLYYQIALDIADARFWRRFIFPKPIQPLFRWAFSDAGTLQRGYLDILAGKHGYKKIPSLFILQSGKAITKPFRLLTKVLRKDS